MLYVPQTNTGMLDEKSKVIILIEERELGKIDLCLRTKGCQTCEGLVELSSVTRLFTKNVGG